MTDIEERIKHAERILGQQANQFFNSELGQFVVSRSLEVVTENMESLTDVNPWDVKSIRTFQNNIAIAKLALFWINESLNLGEQRFAQDELATETFTE